VDGPDGDDANTRVARSTIDASNVDQLEVAWSFTAGLAAASSGPSPASP
jgi:glucose dehydrogenase